MQTAGFVMLVMVASIVVWASTGQAAPAAAADQPAPVTWLVFIDDLHLRFVDTGRLRQAVRTIHRELVRDGDTCVVRCSGPSCPPGGSTTIADCRGFGEASRQITGNGLREDDMLRVRPPPGWDELRYRATTALTAAGSLLDDPAATRGVAHLLYVSNGYLTASGADTALATLSDRAAAMGVRVYPVDTRWGNFDPAQYPALSVEQWRSIRAESTASLATLAERTGGLAVDATGGDEALGKALAAIQARVR